MPTDRTARKARRTGRLVPAGLLALGFVPLLAGAVRLTELTGGAEITAANARFFAAPVPIVAHVVGVTAYTAGGAFQFAARFRRRRRGWHRAAGRVLVGCGLVAALSGLWMTTFSALPPGDEGLLTVFRWVAGTAMSGSLVLGFLAVRRRDIRRHRAWMIRAYAIGLGAGTQALTQAAWLLGGGGPPGPLARALLLALGWVINVVVAELIIRRRGWRVSAA